RRALLREDPGQRRGDARAVGTRHGDEDPIGCHGARQYTARRGRSGMTDSDDKVNKTDGEWRAALTPEQYEVLRRKGTERAFTGAFWDAHDDAMYTCAGCGAELFSSDTKFDSGTGWPSFTAPMPGDTVATEVDRSHGMTRTEVTCRRCGRHPRPLVGGRPGPHRPRHTPHP